MGNATIHLHSGFFIGTASPVFYFFPSLVPLASSFF